MGESRTSPRRMEAKKRAIDAMTLRKAGATYQEIADKLGFKHPAAAQKAVERELKATVVEAVDDLRLIEGERLDRLLRAVWGPAVQGGLQAVDRVLKIMERRAKLFGIDSPTLIAPVKPDGSGLEPKDSLSLDDLPLELVIALRDHLKAKAAGN